MKIKMLALASLLTLSSIASAQSVTVGYAQRALDAGGQEHRSEERRVGKECRL